MTEKIQSVVRNKFLLRNGNLSVTASYFYSQLVSEVSDISKSLSKNLFPALNNIVGHGGASVLVKIGQMVNPRAAVALNTYAIKINPGHAEAYNNLGFALSEIKLYKFATLNYDKAIVLKPDYAEAHYNLGEALRKLGQREAAIHNYDRAIALKPDYVEAYYNRGRVLSELGQRAAAIQSRDRAFAFNFKLSDAFKLKFTTTGEHQQNLIQRIRSRPWSDHFTGAPIAPYTIWQTSDENNQTVTRAFASGIKKLSKSGRGFPLKSVSEFRNPDELRPCVTYGILRGPGFIMQICRDKGIEFWHIDRGYLKPGHFNGYYRISLGGLCADYVADVASGVRWQKLGIDVKPWRISSRHILLCPPVSSDKWFNDISVNWTNEIKAALSCFTSRPIIVRERDSPIPLQKDFEECHCVITNSSNVAVNALLSGVPAITLGKHPVGGWNGLALDDIESDLTAFDRQGLFHFLAWQQFTLDEIRQGWPWEAVQAMQKYRRAFSG